MSPFSRLLESPLLRSQLVDWLLLQLLPLLQLSERLSASDLRKRSPSTIWRVARSTPGVDVRRLSWTRSTNVVILNCVIVDARITSSTMSPVWIGVAQLRRLRLTLVTDDVVRWALRKLKRSPLFKSNDRLRIAVWWRNVLTHAAANRRRLLFIRNVPDRLVKCCHLVWQSRDESASGRCVTTVSE
jgi:hypothetical protein